MLNTLFTLQELCYFWIKKSLCFCDFFFFFWRNPCIVDQKFLLATLAECGNHWFLQRWILTDITCKLPFWGQYGSFFFLLFLSINVPFIFFKYTIILMAGSVAFCLFSFRSNSFDRQKKIYAIISFLNSYCNFLDLIFSWAVKKT